MYQSMGIPTNDNKVSVLLNYIRADDMISL
jgi:hypothetical protein